MEYLGYIIIGTIVLSLCAAFFTVADAYTRINDHGDFTEDSQVYMKGFDVPEQERGVDPSSIPSR